MAAGTFATAINCMDGRVQIPVWEWMRAHLHVDYVDTITEPGPDRIMALGLPSQQESVRKRVGISVEAHGSRAVAIVGHHDCAGNPVPREAHQDQIRRAGQVIQSWGLPVRVLGLWVDERWTVEIVCDSAAPG
ncbi:MAG: carbonic anhydrase [Phycisphaerae bacterium]